MTVRVTLSFPEGALVRLAAEFTDLEGAAIDPTTVTLRVKPPLGTAQVYPFNGSPDLVETSPTGVYWADIRVTEPGKWVYRWEGTGVCEAVAEGAFNVTDSVFL